MMSNLRGIVLSLAALLSTGFVSPRPVLETRSTRAMCGVTRGWIPRETRDTFDTMRGSTAMRGSVDDDDAYNPSREAIEFEIKGFAPDIRSVPGDADEGLLDEVQTNEPSMTQAMAEVRVYGHGTLLSDVTSVRSAACVVFRSWEWMA